MKDVPAGIYLTNPHPSYCEDVPTLTIIFQLNRDYDELLLPLARAGSETMSVSVDGAEPPIVTSEMLGSKDGDTFGSYDLQLGPLQAGSHSLAFAIPDDSPGNGGFGWNALSLATR